MSKMKKENTMRRNNLLHLLDDPVLYSQILKHSLYHYISFIKTLKRERGGEGEGGGEKERERGESETGWRQKGRNKR